MKFLLSIIGVAVFLVGGHALLSGAAANGFNVEQVAAGLVVMPIMFALVGWLRSLLRRPRVNR